MSVMAGNSSFVRLSLPEKDVDLTRGTVQRAEPFLGSRQRLLDPSRYLGEPSLERGSLRLLLGREPRQSLAKLALDLVHPRRHRGDEVLALPLKPRRDLAQLLLESQAARVTELVETLSEQRLALARERLHRPFELPLQSSRRILLGSLDRPFELDGRRIDEARGRPIEDSLQLLHLSPFDVEERRLDPPTRVRLLALDPAQKIALTCRHAIGDLVECAAAIGRVALELRLGSCGHVRSRARHIFPESRDGSLLLFVDRLQAIDVSLEASLERLDQRALALGHL